MAQVVAVNISQKKGTLKHPVDEAHLQTGVTALRAMRMPATGTAR